MSNLVHKIKDAVSGDKHSSNTHDNTTTGAHTGAHTGTTGTTGTHGAPLDNRGVAGPASTTDGPHNSNILNKGDPRVDSDRDHSRNLGANPHGTASTGNYTTGTTGTTGGLAGTHGTAGSGLTGTHGTTGTTGGLPGTHGTHGTTGSGLTGTHNTTGTTGGLPGTHGTHGTTGSGLTGTHGTAGVPLDNRGVAGPASGTDGPHNSNIMNKADPRVDSDRDHSRNLGANPHGTAGTAGTSGLAGTHGTAGTHGSSGLTGTHGTAGTHGSSGLAGTHGTAGTHGASGLTGTHGTTGTSGLSGTTGTHGTHNTTGVTGGLGSSGPGPAPNTAGPHKQDMLNKADPRVDSNLDGSKTVGGDKTFQASVTAGGNALGHKDPTDAAQVPPSVLRKSIGDPEIHHDDPHHRREERHSVSHQETHRGL